MLKGSVRESSEVDQSGPFRLSELEYLQRWNAEWDAEHGPPDPAFVAALVGLVETAHLKYVVASPKGGSGE